MNDQYSERQAERAVLRGGLSFSKSLKKLPLATERKNDLEGGGVQVLPGASFFLAPTC